jgi:hypothetical protein
MHSNLVTLSPLTLNKVEITLHEGFGFVAKNS